MYDDLCLRKQILLYIPSGNGKSFGVYNSVHGKGEIVFGVGFALLLPLKFGLDGVLYSMPLSDLLTFLIAVFLIIQTYRELGLEDAKEVAVSAQSDKNYA